MPWLPLHILLYRYPLQAAHGAVPPAAPQAAGALPITVTQVSAPNTSLVGVAAPRKPVYKNTIIPHAPWDCHICLHWGGATGVNGAAFIWQSHGSVLEFTQKKHTFHPHEKTKTNLHPHRENLLPSVQRTGRATGRGVGRGTLNAAGETGGATGRFGRDQRV